MSNITNMRLRRIRAGQVIQSEVAECGLACVVSIAQAFGSNVSLSDARRRDAVSSKGATLARVIEIASGMGLCSRAVRIEISELGKLRLPAILHWKFNHFVVLNKIDLRRKRAQLMDPAVGFRWVNLSEFEGAFTGVAAEFWPSLGFKPNQQPKSSINFSKFLGLMPELPRYIAISLALAILLQGAALLSPLQAQLVIDEALTKGSAELVKTIAVAFILLSVLQVGVGYIRAWLSLYFGHLFAHRLKGGVVFHLFGLPCQFVTKRSVGDIATRVGSVGPIQDFIVSVGVQVFLDLVLLVASLVILLLYSPVLTVYCMIIVVFYLALRVLAYPIMRELTHESISTSADAESNFIESIRSFTTIKHFGLEGKRLSSWSSKFSAVANVDIKFAKWSTSFGLVSGLSERIGGIVVFYLGALQVLEGEISVGMLIAFNAYRAHFMGASLGLVDQFISLRMIGVHFDRVDGVLSESPEKISQVVLPKRFSGPAVECAGLEYTYAGETKPVVTDVSFTVSNGEFFAVHAPSGAGKSTILRMLWGTAVPSAGTLRVFGQLVTEENRAAIRSYVSGSTQDDSLFSGTILDNITLFDDSPDLDRVNACLRFVLAERMIESMPMGLYGLVGDLGDTLSSGERQRILIARALYRRTTRLLIFDEATSNLDFESESIILKRLERLPVTTIFVTHRPGILDIAKRTLCVDERGSWRVN